MLRHSQCNYRVLSLSHSQALAVQGSALRGHHRPVPRRAELLAGVRFQHARGAGSPAPAGAAIGIVISARGTPREGVLYHGFVQAAGTSR